MLKNKMKELAEARKMAEIFKSSIQDAQSELEDTIEFRHLEDAKNLFKEKMLDVEVVEKEVRLLALEQFDGNHTNTKPVDGIQIKRFEVVTLTDEKEAKIWAAQNAPSVLTINHTKFDGVVKALELPFVEVNVEYRAQIASDLSQYLE